jgi:hypothetical protein
MSFRLLWIGVLVLAAAGCSASVDADGKVLTDRVWFDQTGTAHCPGCMPNPKLRPTKDETEKSIVLPHRNVCENGHPVTWGADDVICWACDGAKHCRACNGTGMAGKDRPCGSCLSSGDEGKATGTGICSECGGKGTVRYGGVADKPH